MEKIVCGGNYTTNLIKDNINELIDENVLVKGDVTTLQSDVVALETESTSLRTDVDGLKENTTLYNGIKTLPQIEGTVLNVKGFYADTSVGGGQFYYDPLKDKTEHNGGTVIAPEAIASWDGSQGDLATLLDWNGTGVGCFVKIISASISSDEFGTLYDNPSVDSSQSLNKGIEAANAHGVYFTIDGYTYGNIEVNNINVRIRGSGTVHPFVRTANAINVGASFKQPSDVTFVTEVTQTVAGRADTNVTKVTSLTHTLSVGSVVKLVSEDLIPTSPASDMVRNGEWAVVLQILGGDIYLDRVLEQNYTNGVRIAEISDLVCDINIRAESTTGNATSGSSLISVKGFFKPKVNVTVSNNDGLGLILAGTYGCKGTVNVSNLTDNATIGSYGYGVLEACTGKSDLVVFQTGFCRHAYTTGKFSGGNEFYSYGEPWASTITGKAHGCSAAAFDTHEQGSDITFTNIESKGSRAILQYRARRTRFINPIGDGNFTAISGVNTDVGTLAEGEVVGIFATNCNKPINLKDQSGTGNAVTLKILGDSYITYKPTSTGAAIDSQAEVDVYGSLNITMTGGTDFNVIASDVGSFTIHGDVVINTSAGSASNPFKVNNDFTVKKTGSLQIISAAITKLFTSSSSGQAATTNIVVANMAVSPDVSISNRFGFPFLTQHVKIESLVNQNNSTSRLVFATSTTTSLLTDALDQLVFIRIVPSAGFLSLTEVSDGKFIGQKLYIENASSTNTLSIPNTISNVKYSIDILPEKVREIVWEGSYWA
jgi:hypothetical protein